jgi:hypothetical protein
MEPVRSYPFATCPRTGLDLDPEYAALRNAEPVVRVRLPYGEPAWLVTRYAEMLPNLLMAQAGGAQRGIRPALNPLPVGDGYTEQLTDDGHRARWPALRGLSR